MLEPRKIKLISMVLFLLLLVTIEVWADSNVDNKYNSGTINNGANNANYGTKHDNRGVNRLYYNI